MTTCTGDYLQGRAREEKKTGGVKREKALTFTRNECRVPRPVKENTCHVACCGGQKRGVPQVGPMGGGREALE